MKSSILGVILAAAPMLLARQARADITPFSISGGGISAQGTLTYTLLNDGSANITGITGTFTDTNTGLNNKPSISNVSITGLVPINPVNPLPAEVTAPNFSYFPITNMVPSPPAQQASPALSFDNTFYPNGSPSVCTDYPFFGGLLDVYGVMFTLANGDAVGVWSNGITPGPATPAIYGVAVADATNTYDYVGGGVTFTPEPSGFAVMALAIGGLGLGRRRK